MSIPEKQQAIVIRKINGPVEDLLIEKDYPTPKLTGPNDVLIKVKAAALNPVDYKVKATGMFAQNDINDGLILGWDGAGVVVQIGKEVKGFKPGDEVWYSGLISRPGSLQQYQLVDYRIISHKPKSLKFDDAASLPLTTITAYEGLKEHLRVQPGKRILIIAGAGGVGSIAIQLAKIWGLTVVATASRPESVEWCKELGADQVVNHHNGIAKEFETQKIEHVDYVFNTFDDKLINDFGPIIKPFGGIVGINGDADESCIKAITSLFVRRISYCQENMFGRPFWDVEPEKQGALLQEVADLIDAGKVRATSRPDQKFEWTQIHQAFHKLLDRSVIGKITITVPE
eukprot:TRINITY_DN8444_c0_g2_i1.p1 TRINITY_DN8444_c0_g2~~TRINITY_DN8444_c0_g2_i1.p1  ORF type:complete len:343 (-),score=106.02 TRINITY_DN8444_c0_g2_i1:29-1057(-)